MATRMAVCGGLLLVAMVMIVAEGQPPSIRTEQDEYSPKEKSFHHVKLGPPEGDKVLAIGTPLMLSRYENYDPEPRTPGPMAVMSWWERSKVYRSLFKCPEGEKRDAIGICRQPWDGIDPDYDF